MFYCFNSIIITLKTYDEIYFPQVDDHDFKFNLILLISWWKHPNLFLVLDYGILFASRCSQFQILLFSGWKQRCLWPLPSLFVFLLNSMVGISSGNCRHNGYSRVILHDILIIKLVLPYPLILFYCDLISKTLYINPAPPTSEGHNLYHTIWSLTTTSIESKPY